MGLIFVLIGFVIGFVVSFIFSKIFKKKTNELSGTLHISKNPENGYYEFYLALDEQPERIVKRDLATFDISRD